MADPETSNSSPDEDQDFDPTADMLTHDYDDEHTLDEEEALSNDESVANELDDLQKDSEIPVEELLAMYGYNNTENNLNNKTEPSMSEVNNVSSNQEYTPISTSPNTSVSLKDEINIAPLRHDLNTVNNLFSQHVSSTINNNLEANCLSPKKSLNYGENIEDLEVKTGSDPFPKANFVTAELPETASDEDEDYDPEQDEDWKKTVSVGLDHQAIVPDTLNKTDDYILNKDMEDRVLWNPSNLDENQVAKYLSEVHKHNQSNSQGIITVATGLYIKDDEQALYLLLQCENNFEEALRRHKLQAMPPTDPMSLWSEEECRNFENGLRVYGKDFYLNHINKVRSRSVREIVHFYYLWKKTERHDAFAARTRLEKKKYALHPGITDYMDRFINEYENPLMSENRDHHSTNSPKNHSLICPNDFKRHDNKLACGDGAGTTGYEKQAMDQCGNLLDYHHQTSSQERYLTSHIYTNMPGNIMHIPNHHHSHHPSSCFININNPSINNNSMVNISTDLLMSGNINNYDHCTSSLQQHSYLFPDSHSGFLERGLVEAEGLLTGQNLVDLRFLPPSDIFHLTSTTNKSLPLFTASSYYQSLESGIINSDVIASSMCNLSTKVSSSLNDRMSEFTSLGSNIMDELDVDSLLASQISSTVAPPQELSITDINMIFGNSAPADNIINISKHASSSMMMMMENQNYEHNISHHHSLSNIVSDNLINNGSLLLQPPMQRLCSVDSIEPSIESISASIQDFVDPESMSAENILSVLEGNSCTTSEHPSLNDPYNSGIHNYVCPSGSFLHSEKFFLDKEALGKTISFKSGNVISNSMIIDDCLIDGHGILPMEMCSSSLDAISSMNIQHNIMAKNLNNQTNLINSNLHQSILKDNSIYETEASSIIPFDYSSTKNNNATAAS